MTDRRIYVACLASYNAGTLHGRWIDADDAETMREEIAAMLRQSPHPNVEIECPDCGGTIEHGPKPAACKTCRGRGTVPSAEEWAVHDYDGIPSNFGEYPDLDRVAAYVEAVGDLSGDGEIEAFDAWLDNEGDSPRDLDGFREDYAGTFDTLADWAEELVADTGMLADVPDSVARYFDYESYARDARLGGDVWTHHGSEGLHVFWNH